MKSILKLIFIFLLFIISLLIFLPKEELFNLAEKELVKKNIIVSNEQRVEKLFSLKLEDCEVYYDGINVSYINKIELNTFLFFNTLEAKNIRISNSFKNMFPSKIENLNLNYSIWKFNKISINSSGEFGKLSGEILLFDRKIIAELNPSEIMKSKYNSILKQFKLVEGRYYYELKF